MLIVVSEPPEKRYHPDGRRKGLDEFSSENKAGKMDTKQESPCLQRFGDETSLRKLATCR